MYISKLAFEKIKEFEGCKLQAYQDAAGVWTIGYGHTYNVREGDRISQWYADDLLKDDIENVERQLMALHDSEVLDMTQEQLDAVVSFVFKRSDGISCWASPRTRYVPSGCAGCMLAASGWQGLSSEENGSVTAFLNNKEYELF